MYAPIALAETLGGSPFAVDVTEVTGSLHGIAADDDDGRGQASLLRRAFYLANFSLLVPVGLSLGVCYLVFHSLVAQLNAVEEDRRMLLQERLAEPARFDNDRAQLIKEALEIAKESRTQAAELYRLQIELQDRRPPPAPPSDHPKDGTEKHSDGAAGSEHACSETPSGASLHAGDFTIFGKGGAIEFSDLAKAISNVAGPEKIREVIKGVGDGIGVARDTVGLASDIADLYWKLFPKEKKGDMPPPPPTLLPGTLLDEKVSFSFDSTDLDRDMRLDLRRLSEELTAHPVAVLIEGHTDGAGPLAYNRQLSQRRANAVMTYLVDQGVPARLMHAYGYGQGYLWRPYAPEDAANRRVRIIACVVADVDRCKSAHETGP